MAHSPSRSDSDVEVKEKEIDAVTHLENGPPPKTKGLTEEERLWLSNIDPKEANRIYHKVDRRLVPMLAALYLIAHLDRGESQSETPK